MNDEQKAGLRALAQQHGLLRAFELDPDLIEAALQRAAQPLAPLPASYGPTTEPAISFKASV
jgi:hypothetical protein